MRRTALATAFSLIFVLLLPTAAVADTADAESGSHGNPAHQAEQELTQPDAELTEDTDVTVTDDAAPVTDNTAEDHTVIEAATSSETNAALEAEPRSPLPVALQNSETVREIEVDGIRLLIRRVATGTGHGTASQCGINSSNTHLFPDGNATGAPADDTADDEYVCWNDAVQYQIEFNEAPTGLTTAQRLQFSFSIADQGLSGMTSQNPYRFQQTAQELCPTATGGSHTVISRSINTQTLTLSCEYEFQPGISGTVQLPVMTLTKSTTATRVLPWIRPAMTVNGESVDVPPATFLSYPQVDLVLRHPQGTNPELMTVDGVAGLFVGTTLRSAAVPFPTGAWSTTKGNPQFGVTANLQYQIGLYDGGPDTNTPLPLPADAKVYGRTTVDQQYVDHAGNPITPIPDSTRTGVWIPLSEARAMGGIGLWARITPLEAGVPNGPSNFWKDEPWDPGTGESCDFATSSLGLRNVLDGQTAKNNNCYLSFTPLHLLPPGNSTKSINGATADIKTVSPHSTVEVELMRGQAISTLQDYALCDTWESREQTSRKLGASQSIITDRIAEVSVRLGNERITVPENIWRAEYGYSPISVSRQSPPYSAGRGGSLHDGERMDY